MSRRTKKFVEPSPPGWMPAAGDLVWLSPSAKGGGMRSVAKVLYTVAPNFVVCELKYGTKKWKKTFTVDELRPHKATP